ncbi:MAG: alginate export family protein [Nitrospiraceae bacterium]
MMKRGKLSLAVGALLLAGVASPAFADPPLYPEDKLLTQPTNIKPVPRGMPDLTPYWNFDPPKNPLFDLKNLTFSGDMRVRPEVRTNSNFGVSQVQATGRAAGANDWYVQQWMRLGINYSLSPDVDFFVQPQWAKNWGAANNTNGSGAGCSAAGSICSNDAFNNGQADSLFMRQAYIMVRNLGIQGLSMKAGRQLLVMGDHRLFGHFDWANTGFTHDGVTFQYQQPNWEVWTGWLRPMETDFNTFGAQSTSFGVMPQGAPTSNAAKAGQDSDLFFARLAWKPMAGLAIEPLWVWQRNSAVQTSTGAAASEALAAHANGQSRHTVGARVALRKGMFDGSAEAYHQFGSMDIGQSGQQTHINALAIAAEAGVTLSMPWSPRIGVEFNYASGDGDARACNSGNVAACRGTSNTFENLYPTNHIVMGYADVMAWRNMVAYSASLQFLPFDNAANHFEFRYWNFRKAVNGDCWYRAAQNCYFNASNGSNHLTDEIDFIYTLFFKGNKVAWQTGASYLFAGSFLDKQAGAGNSAVNQTWAYTQLHINF